MTPEKQVQLLRDIDAAGEVLRDLVSKIDMAQCAEGHDQQNKTHATAHPHRWIGIGRTDLQTGLMALRRAVEQPTYY